MVMAKCFRAERVFVRHRRDGAVQPEAPAVERAGEAADRAEIGKHQLAAAVRADIIMRLQAAVLEADDDKAFRADFEPHEIAILAHVARRASQQPGLRPHPVPFGVLVTPVMIAGRVGTRRAIVDRRRAIIERMGRTGVNIPATKREAHQRNPSKIPCNIIHAAKKKTNMIACYLDLWHCECAWNG